MPNKPLKPCNKIGCNELTKNRYCDKHEQEEKKIKADGNSYYDKNKRNQETNVFYHSKAWIKTRQVALLRDNYLCQHCLKEKKITKADMVHHIVEVKKDWSKRLELSNLKSLCHSCHSKIDHYKG